MVADFAPALVVGLVVWVLAYVALRGTRGRS